MKINQYIDHTLLKADATKDQVKKIVEEAKEYDFKSVCVNSSYVSFIRNMDKDIRITSVIGFPLGAMTTKAKVFEAEDAIKNGADEIDMVINRSNSNILIHISNKRNIRRIYTYRLKFVFLSLFNNFFNLIFCGISF